MQIKNPLVRRTIEDKSQAAQLYLDIQEREQSLIREHHKFHHNVCLYQPAHLIREKYRLSKDKR